MAIRRVRRGWTSPAHADAGEAIARAQLRPGIAARAVPGRGGTAVPNRGDPVTRRSELRGAPRHG